MEAFYTVGLGLGQTIDYTALAVVERPSVSLDGQPPYALRHLQRFHPGTPYTQIVPAVARLVAMPPLVGDVTLVADPTGVRRAVVDLLRGRSPATSSRSPSPPDSRLSLPRRARCACPGGTWSAACKFCCKRSKASARNHEVFASPSAYPVVSPSALLQPADWQQRFLAATTGGAPRDSTTDARPPFRIGRIN
jgi:hypothetical protein